MRFYGEKVLEYLGDKNEKEIFLVVVKQYFYIIGCQNG